MDHAVDSTVETPQSHRFSNRIYPSQPNTEDTTRLFTEGLEPYLKPPTPPPTGVSFTPSYTTSFHDGLDEGSAFHAEAKPETTVIESLDGQGTDAKPISLMVEIFPANDYQFPRKLVKVKNM